MRYEVVRMAQHWAVYGVDLVYGYKTFLVCAGLTEWEARMLASQLLIEQALTAR